MTIAGNLPVVVAVGTYSSAVTGKFGCDSNSTLSTRKPSIAEVPVTCGFEVGSLRERAEQAKQRGADLLLAGFGRGRAW